MRLYINIIITSLFLCSAVLNGAGITDWYNDNLEKIETGIGFAVLKIPVSARRAAMGGTYAAGSTPQQSVSTNPASMLADQTSFIFNHQNHFQGIHQEYLGILIAKPNYALGLSFSGLFVDGLEFRSGPGPSEGDFSAYDFISSAAISYRVYKDLSMGIRTKLLHQKIFQYSTTVYAFDFGVHYKLNKYVNLGALLENFGPKYTYINNSEKTSRLPTGWRVGTALNLPEYKGFNGSLALDAWKYPDVRMRWDLGAEIVHSSGLALRAGGRFNSDTQSWTAGLGYSWKAICFDYAFLPYSEDLGNSHLITMGINL
ncbi:MAG: hypothetical protein APR63_09830 [Desulfuromonas sp. SDB]|nr:MAG: hypothetical protein APR63_09830 [Desulfuromonas sp. SDB]